MVFEDTGRRISIMIQYNTVEEALEELRKGHVILVTDDADRENEGDFICAAEYATTEYADVCSLCGKAPVSADGFEQYGQS